MAEVKDDIDLAELYYSTRDPALREELILRYTSLVHYVVGRLGITENTSSEYDDLVSQGVIGLIEAVDRYNPKFGTRLSTYATLKIRSKVLDYLRELDWLPRSARKRVRTVQDAMMQLESQLQRVPTDEELAEYLDMNMETLQQALVDSSHMMISLDEDGADSSSDENISLYEKLTDDQQENPMETYEAKDLQREMVSAIQTLSEREQLVLSLYYFEELTLKEIGETLGVSESRVSQIHGRAMISLKTMMTSSRRKPAGSLGN